MKIVHVSGQEILDSRGQPTVACTIELSSGQKVTSSVPSGSSVGKHEAKELRDHDHNHFGGKGVQTAINHLEHLIGPRIVGKIPDVTTMDATIIDCDGTPDKSHLGANAILAASIAIVKAQALYEGLELYELIAQLHQTKQPTLPCCMFNVINGGMHADSGLALQEFMIMPTLNNVHNAIEQATATYEAIKSLLHGKHYSTAIGDEGGFAPQFDQEGINREYAALTMLQLAVKKADLNPAIIRFGLDAAASHFFDTTTKMYNVHGQAYTADQLINWYDELCQNYPIMSIEDGLDEEDWDGWQRMTKRFGKKLMIVGDDIFVTNVERIKRGITNHVANATLIKPNQIGTVTETLAAIKCCQQAGYTVVISHRSGETDDTFIADLAVGTAAPWLKAGAPVRGERVAKYNRLMEIEERLR